MCRLTLIMWGGAQHAPTCTKMRFTRKVAPRTYDETQCCGSVRFSDGSGSGSDLEKKTDPDPDPDPGTDPDPDPAKNMTSLKIQ